MSPTPDAVAWLREAREHKGLTLDDLARATKIPLKSLKALEAGATDRLPPTFFTRGFVKAYAKEVGLDPNSSAERYLAQVAPDAPVVDVAEVRQKEVELIHAPRANRFGRLTIAAAMIGLVGYVGPLKWDGLTSKVDAVAVAQAPPADTVPTATTPEPATNLAGGPLQFELKPQGACWFSAAADGNQQPSELLQAGDNRPIEVRDELVLRVGDASACAFSINGQDGRSLGAPGAPVTVRITKENFRELLKVAPAGP